MSKISLIKYWRPGFQSFVRIVMSLLLHGFAVAWVTMSERSLQATEPSGGFQMFVGFLGIVMAWYFGSREMPGVEAAPFPLVLARSVIRAVHALGGLIFTVIMWGAYGFDSIPAWYIGILGTMVMFYFIEASSEDDTPRTEPTGVPAQ